MLQRVWNSNANFPALRCFAWWNAEDTCRHGSVYLYVQPLCGLLYSCIWRMAPALYRLVSRSGIFRAFLLKCPTFYAIVDKYSLVCQEISSGFGRKRCSVSLRGEKNDSVNLQMVPSSVKSAVCHISTADRGGRGDQANRLRRLALDARLEYHVGSAAETCTEVPGLQLRAALKALYWSRNAELKLFFSRLT